MTTPATHNFTIHHFRILHHLMQEDAVICYSSDGDEAWFSLVPWPESRLTADEIAALADLRAQNLIARKVPATRSGNDTITKDGRTAYKARVGVLADYDLNSAYWDTVGDIGLVIVIGFTHGTTGNGPYKKVDYVDSKGKEQSMFEVDFTFVFKRIERPTEAVARQTRVDEVAPMAPEWTHFFTDEGGCLHYARETSRTPLLNEVGLDKGPDHEVVNAETDRGEAIAMLVSDFNKRYRSIENLHGLGIDVQELLSSLKQPHWRILNCISGSDTYLQNTPTDIKMRTSSMTLENAVSKDVVYLLQETGLVTQFDIDTSTPPPNAGVARITLAGRIAVEWHLKRSGDE